MIAHKFKLRGKLAHSMKNTEKEFWVLLCLPWTHLRGNIPNSIPQCTRSMIFIDFDVFSLSNMSTQTHTTLKLHTQTQISLFYYLSFMQPIALSSNQTRGNKQAITIRNTESHESHSSIRCLTMISLLHIPPLARTLIWMPPENRSINSLPNSEFPMWLLLVLYHRTDLAGFCYCCCCYYYYYYYYHYSAFCLRETQKTSKISIWLFCVCVRACEWVTDWRSDKGRVWMCLKPS